MATSDQIDARFWQGRRVLVTGAGGFIGSHLAERLVQLGARVRAFVRYTSRSKLGALADVPESIRSEVEIHAGDLRDEAAVREACRDCDRVFHLGALVGIPYSYLHPAEVVATNLGGTLNVAVACREFAVGRLVFVSSSEVYGTAQTEWISEDHPLHAQSPYAASKVGGESLVGSFHDSFGIEVVTVRPFNAYGPRQSARAVIPAIIEQALAGDRVVLGNIETRRDFTYVEDTVDGMLRAGAAEGVAGQTFNLGSRTEIRIADLAAEIGALLGKRIKIAVDPARLRPERSEVLRLRADSRRAERSLGWRPRVGLPEGLSRTIEWLRAHRSEHEAGGYAV